MFFLALGTMLGDLIKSYVKRRRQIPAGTAWPLVDQLDAVLGAFLLGWWTDVAWLTHGSWFTTNFIPGRWLAVAGLIPVYLLLHHVFSRLAHQNGLKRDPQ